jgi:hypothetical protein
MSNYASIQRIGLFQIAHRLSKPAYGTWVQNGHWNLLGGKQQQDQPFVPSAGFHGYQVNLVGTTKLG